MRTTTLLSFLLLSLVANCQAKDSVIVNRCYQRKDMFVIDSVGKSYGQAVTVWHRLTDSTWLGLDYVFRGLGKPNVHAGDTAVIHQPIKRVRHYWLSIIAAKQKISGCTFIDIPVTQNFPDYSPITISDYYCPGQKVTHWDSVYRAIHNPPVLKPKNSIVCTVPLTTLN